MNLIGIDKACDKACGFLNPPASARAHTWWHWNNGNVGREGITADLEAFARAGLGGVQLFYASCTIPDGPVAFNSAEWHDLFRHASRECNRLGLEFCFHNCPGWSSSGGPWIKPEQAMKVLTCAELRVSGPASFAAAPPTAPSCSTGIRRRPSRSTIRRRSAPATLSWRMPSPSPRGR